MKQKLPLYAALDPQGRRVSLLTDADGRIITDLQPVPIGAVPITKLGVRVDSQGRTLIK